MARIDLLLESFKRHVSIPPKQDLPLSQRVWFVVYDPEDERRMENRIPDFEIATRDADLKWSSVDFSGAFADWTDALEDPDERETCLTVPEIAEEYANPGFRDFLRARIDQAVAHTPTAEASQTIFALSGLMELYDFIHVSDVIDSLDRAFPGILLVFFPGEREGNSYRFLGARTGWDYLAIPILAES